MSDCIVSFVIATFNAERTLQRCIDSILKQSIKNYELIIIDGASRDNTVKLLELNSTNIAYWISEPDNGIYDAWNKGVAKAKGDWLWFLGADDYLYENSSLENYVQASKDISSEVKVAYSKVQLVNENQEEVFSIGEQWAQCKESFLNRMSLPHQGVLHHKSLFADEKLFDTQFKVAGDYEFLLRELPHNDAFFYPHDTVCMQVGGVSSAPLSSIDTVKEIRYAQKLHGQILPNSFIVLSLIRAHFRVLIFTVLGKRISYRLMDIYRVLMGKKTYWNKLL